MLKRTVLLVMDFQQGIVDGVASESVVPAAAKAVDAARATDVRVVFVRVAFRAGYPEVSVNNAIFGGIAGLGDFMNEEKASTQIVEELHLRDDDPVVVKRRVSAFSGSDLDAILRATQAEELVLAGISTSGVVLSTLRQAADLDYRLVVLSDACADRETDVHDLLMDSVFQRQARVVTTDEWIASLEA